MKWKPESKAREWSLNEAISEDRDITAMEMLEDDSANQEQLLIAHETEAQLTEVTQKALKRLDPRERFIVSKRFMDDTPWTLQKLGEHFGTSRERVRQLEKRALTKLRNELTPDMSPGALLV